MNVVIPTPQQRLLDERPAAATTASSGSGGAACAVDLLVEAVERLPKWSPVTFDGRLARCLALRDTGRFAGVAIADIEPGQRGAVRSDGCMEGAPLAAGAAFVGDGRLESAAPERGWSQQVGTVLPDGSLFVRAREPVLL